MAPMRNSSTALAHARRSVHTSSNNVRSNMSNIDPSSTSNSHDASVSSKSAGMNASGYPLQRGSACLSCRKRKMKCDAGKPTCLQCVKGNRVAECEYDDGKTKSRTQMLQEKVSRLQDRIQELETRPSRHSSASPPSPASSTMQPTSSYTLTQTHNSGLIDPELYDASMGASFGPDPVFGNGSGHLDVPLYHGNASTGMYSSASSSGSGSPGPEYNGGNLVSVPHHTHGHIPAPAQPSWGLRTENDGQWWSNDELTPQWRTTLLDIFLPHRHQCSFSVHVPSFLASINATSSPVMTTLRQPPHPALLNTLYLLATHFAPTATLSQLEPIFLDRALNHLSSALEHSDRLVNLIQASCLLATWFFGKGRLLEGYYHASSAGRLAIGLGLHQIRSDAFPPILIPGVEESEGILPAATSKLELGERILAFWQVFNVDRCWAVATGLPSGLSDDDHPRTRILTVWPRDVEEYADGSHTTFDQQHAFVHHQPSLRSLYPPFTQPVSPPTTPQQHIPKDSLVALRAKATALFERASRLSASCEQNHNQGQTHPGAGDKFWGDFRSLNFAITTFISSLPNIPQRLPGGHNQAARATVLVIHSLAQVALIQLHHTFANKDVSAHDKCLEAAGVVLNLIPMMDEGDYAYLDPIMGTCWMCVSDVLLREQLRRQAEGAGTAGLVNRELDTVITAMKCLGTVFPLAGFQVTKVEQGRQDIVF